MCDFLSVSKIDIFRDVQSITPRVDGPSPLKKPYKPYDLKIRDIAIGIDSCFRPLLVEIIVRTKSKGYVINPATTPAPAPLIIRIEKVSSLLHLKRCLNISKK